MWHSLSVQHAEMLHKEIEYEQRQIETIVNLELKQRMGALARMAKRWEIDQGTEREKWEQDAFGYYQDFAGHKAVEWVDTTYHVRWIVPLQGNEAAQDLNLAFEESRRVALLLAKESRENVMTQPVELVQGGLGLLLFSPLFVENTFDGFLLSVYSLNEMMDDIIPNDVFSNVDIILFDGSHEIYRSAGNHAAIEEGRPYPLNFEVYGRNWRIQTSLRSETLSIRKSNLPEIILVIGMLFTGLLGFILFQNNKIRTASMSLQSLNASLSKEISKKELFEADLRTSEERFALAAEGARNGIWDWIDVNGQEEWWSPRFYNLLGYENGEIPATLENFGAALHPDDKERTFAMVNEHFAGTADFDLEYRLRTKSGAYRWFHGSGIVSRDEAGNPIRMVGSIIDIQEKKNIELALEDSQAFMKLIIEKNPDLIFVKDKDLKIIEANPAFLDLYPEEMRPHVIGTTTLEKYRPEEVAAFTIEDRKAFETGYAEKVETINFPDGRKKILHMKKILFKSATGEAFILCTGRDITKEKEHERILAMSNQALKRSNKELDDFAYVASHDLKAPLRAIQSLSQWIIEDTAELLPEESQKHFEQMQQRVERMERLLEDLLRYSRVGRISTDIQPVDTKALVQDIIDLIAPRKELQFNIAPDLPTVMSEQSPLHQVFQNLISNAIKHNDKPESSIDVSWQEKGDLVSFTVKDNGPGIDAKYHERIFQIFQTLKPRDEIEGSGMGLAIVKKLINHHGGTISVSSKLGEGTAFTFTWPREAKPTEIPVLA